MIGKKKTVAVLIVNYNGIHFLKDCLPSLFASNDVSVKRVIYVVDNQSTDDSIAYVTSHWHEVRVVRSDTNRGFAGGNNLGLEQIKKDLPDCEYVCLLNQDTIVESGFLDPLISYLDDHPRVGAVQPLLVLYPETAKVNSTGNVIHYLGFGYSGSNGAPVDSVVRRPVSVNYASGAAVVLRMSAVREVGLFDDFMFMYLEDLDLGWKLHLAGWDSVMVPASRVYHNYEFSRGMKHYYYFERNRLWIIFKNYRFATLLCLLPAFLIMEAGQLARAASQGKLGDKMRSYIFFFNMRNLRQLISDRQSLKRVRRASDAEMLKSFSGRIEFQPLQGPLVRYLANPFFDAYVRCIRSIIVW